MRATAAPFGTLTLRQAQGGDLCTNITVTIGLDPRLSGYEYKRFPLSAARTPSSSLSLVRCADAPLPNPPPQVGRGLRPRRFVHLPTRGRAIAYGTFRFHCVAREEHRIRFVHRRGSLDSKLPFAPSKQPICDCPAPQGGRGLRPRRFVHLPTRGGGRRAAPGGGRPRKRTEKTVRSAERALIKASRSHAQSAGLAPSAMPCNRYSKRRYAGWQDAVRRGHSDG